MRRNLAQRRVHAEGRSGRRAGSQRGWSRALVLAAALLNGIAAWASADDGHAAGRSEYRAPLAVAAPAIDGLADDPAWAGARWREIDQRWLGPEFGDEDFSGGDHQYNHNAFAYHMSLDNQAIDIGSDRSARSYSSHVQSRWRQQGDKVVWELAIEVHPDSYRDDAPANPPVRLSAGKVMGLMVAYCDNDGSELRENFVGSEPVHQGKKDRGWIDAGLFGKLILDEAP